MADASLHLNKAEFEKFVRDHRADLLLVDFYADWCPHCRVFGPVLENVARAYRGQNVHVIKIDTDAEERLAADYRVEVLPTLLVMREGQELARETGSKSQSYVEGLIKKFTEAKG